MVKTVVAIGDTHVGNDGAIQLEEVWTDNDNPEKRKPHPANKTQLEILKTWEQMCDDYIKPDVLILNGDLVDGKNYKDSGLGIWTSDIELQSDVLAELVSWLKPRKVVGTSGSPYHSERNPNMDRVATIKCAKGIGLSDEEAKACFKSGYISIDVNGCRMHFMHKISVSKTSWQYRTTPIARSLVLAALNEPEYGHYNVVGKSHAHYFTYAGFTSSMSMIMPCWKAYDPFGDVNVEFVNPAIGYCVFEVSDDGSYSWDWNIKHFKQSQLNPDVMV